MKIKFIFLVLSFFSITDLFCQIDFTRTWRMKVVETPFVVDVIDIDQDGLDEVISIGPGGPSTAFWALYSLDSANLSMREKYVSEAFTNGSLVITANKNNLQTRYLGIGQYSGSNLIIKLTNLNTLDEYTYYDSGNIIFWGFADDGQDGHDDLFIRRDEIVEIYALPEFEYKRSIPISVNTGGTIFINIDSDSDIEIVNKNISDGTISFVDIENGQYEAGSTFINNVIDVDFYDVENAGYSQVVCLKRRDSSPDSIFVYNHQQQTVTFKGNVGIDTFTIPTYSNTIRIDDLDNDGNLEVMAAGYQRIIISNLQDMSTKKIYSCQSNVYSDRKTFGVKYKHQPSKSMLTYASTPNNLIVQDYSIDTLFWVSNSYYDVGFDYPEPVIAGDIDEDQSIEILVLTPQMLSICDENGTGYTVSDRGNIRFFDAQDKTIKYESNFDANNVVYGFYPAVVNHLKMENFDSDPQKEILASYNNSTLAIYDYVTGEGGMFASFDTIGVAIKNLEIEDIDLDGETEIILSFETISAGNDGHSYVYVLNKQGEVIWRSRHLGVFDTYSDNYFFKIGNIDQDPQPEIVVYTHDFTGYISIIDGVTKEIEQEVSPYFSTSMELFDYDNDGVQDILIGGYSGIGIVNNQFEDIGSIQLPPGHITNIKKFYFNKDSIFEFAITTNGFLKIMDNSLTNELWSSDFLSFKAGGNNQLEIIEVNGQPRIYIRTDFTVEEYSYLEEGSNPIEDKGVCNWSKMRVHPNPCKNKCNLVLESNSQGPFDVLMFDMLGVNRKTSKGMSIQNGNITIDVSELSSGLYSIMIIDYSTCKMINGKVVVN